MILFSLLWRRTLLKIQVKSQKVKWHFFSLGSYSTLFMWLLPDVNSLSAPTLFTIAISNCPSRIQSPYTWRCRDHGNRLSVRVRSTWLACRHPLHPIYLIPPGPKSVVWEDLSPETESLYFKPRAPYIGKLRVGLFLSFYWNLCCFFFFPPWYRLGYLSYLRAVSWVLPFVDELHFYPPLCCFIYSHFRR